MSCNRKGNLSVQPTLGVRLPSLERSFIVRWANVCRWLDDEILTGREKMFR
ncbi:MAG: hypothetical protein LUG18_12930 [Candidatus Azobacteroides sp.]|nr:hypothetical protein [Candidatus Azobacteroides sp.]